MRLSIEELTGRLAEIQDQISAMASGASREKFALLTERDQLRDHAKDFRRSTDANRSTSSLQAELDEHKSRRRQTVRSRTGYVMAKGGNSAGPASGAWVKLGRQGLSGGNLGTMNVRISELEDELASRAQKER